MTCYLTWGLVGWMALTGCDRGVSTDDRPNSQTTGTTSSEEKNTQDTQSPESSTSQADSTQETSSNDASNSASSSTQTNSDSLPKDLVVKSYEEGIANKGYTSSLMFYPELDDDRTLPLVIVMHGWRGSKEKMQWIAQRTAKAGFASLVVTASNATNILATPKDWIQNYNAAIDSLKAENDRAKSPLHGRLDLQKISLVAHSMGGGGALFFAQQNQTALSSIVALAPYSTDANKEVDQVKAPTLILTGSKDTVAPSRMGSSFYDALSHDLAKKYEELEDVGHNDFELDGAHHELIITEVLNWLGEHGRISRRDQ